MSRTIPEIAGPAVELVAVAGAGIPVFTGDFRPHQFALSGSRTFSNGTIVTTYGRP